MFQQLFRVSCVSIRLHLAFTHCSLSNLFYLWNRDPWSSPYWELRLAFHILWGMLDFSVCFCNAFVKSCSKEASVSYVLQQTISLADLWCRWQFSLPCLLSITLYSVFPLVFRSRSLLTCPQPVTWVWTNVRYHAHSGN